MRINPSLQIFVTSLIIMCAAGFIVLTLPPHGELAFSPDSINYLAAAHNLANGHGLSLFNFSLFDPRYVPYTTWPPLYPLVLATGMKPEWIQALAIAGIASLTCWLLARRAKYPLYIACGLALIVTLPWPVLMDASFVWSEPLALFWLFAGVVALSGLGKGRQWNSRQDVWYWLAAVFAFVMAIYTRYAAILFIPGVMLALLRAPIPWRKRVTLSIATPLSAFMLLTPLFIHNLMSDGQLSGSARIASHIPLSTLLSTEFFDFGWVFANDLMARSLLVLFVISLMLALVIYWKDSLRMVPVTDEPEFIHIKWLGWIAVSLAVVYILGITTLRVWKTFDWDPRILSLGMPPLLLALAVWMRIMWKTPSLRWEKVALALPFLGILALAGVTSWQMRADAYLNWRNFGTPLWHVSPFRFFSDLYPLPSPKVKGVVICNRPQLIAFRTGWDVRGIPDGTWSREELLRIAGSAAGVLVDSWQTERLAKTLHSVVNHPRFIHLVDHATLMIWSGEKEHREN